MNALAFPQDEGPERFATEVARYKWATAHQRGTASAWLRVVHHLQGAEFALSHLSAAHWREIEALRLLERIADRNWESALIEESRPVNPSLRPHQ